MKNRILLIAAVLFSSVATNLISQNEAPDSLRQYFVQPIAVSAMRDERPAFRTPYAVSLIDNERLRQTGASFSLENALQAVPGVTVNNRQNLSLGDRISIRGIGSRASFGVRGVKVLLDGVPLTFADGQSQLNNLDLNGAERIEVLRGPASTLYGNAAGGVILIESGAFSEAENKVTFEPSFSLGDFGLKEFSAKLRVQNENAQLSVSARKLDVSGFREHSDSRIHSINTTSKIKFSNAWSASGVLQFVDAPFLLNPSSLNKQDAADSPQTARFFVRSQGAGKIVEQLNAGLTLENRSSGAGRFRSTFFFTNRSLFNPIPGRIIDLERDAFGFRNLYTRRIEKNGQVFFLKTGLDFEFQNDDRRENENDGLPDDVVGELLPQNVIENVQVGETLLNQRERVFGVGVFTELEYSPSPKISYLAGIRFDRFTFKVENSFAPGSESQSISMNQPSPMLGITWRPKSLFALYANFSSAFQTPTTVELTNRPNQEGGLNDNLNPEYIRSLEIGGKGDWLEKNVRYNAAVFTMAVENMLIPFQVQDPESEEIFYRNAGAAWNRGFEADLSWHIQKSIRLTSAFTLMDFRFRNYEIEGNEGLQQLKNNKLPGVPSYRFFAAINYKALTAVFVELNAEFVDGYFANDLNGDGGSSDAFINDGYALVNLNAGFSKALQNFRMTFYFGVNNLFDVRYNASIVPNAFGARFFEPSPGRNWHARASLPLDF